MRNSEDGQTVVASLAFLTVLLMFAGVVIDGGNYLLVRRNLQGVADAAALAGVKELPTRTATANTVAADYVNNQNSVSGASVDLITITGTDTIKVDVKKAVAGGFLSLFGMGAPTIKATATAQVSQATAIGRILPIAIMRNSYTSGTQYMLHNDTVGSLGRKNSIIFPPYGVNCVADTQWGSGDVTKDFIAGTRQSCAAPVGTLVQNDLNWDLTKIENGGFDVVLNGNTDTFAQVFELDPSTGKYIIKKPTSPRIIVIPVVENNDGTATWDTTNPKRMRIVGYQIAYAGKTDAPSPYTPCLSSNEECYVTPVDVILPPDFANATFGGTWSASNPSPIVYHLTN